MEKAYRFRLEELPHDLKEEDIKIYIDVKKEEKGPPVRPVLPKRIQQNEKKLEKSKSLFDLKDTIKSAFGPSKPLVQKQVSGTSHGFNF